MAWSNAALRTSFSFWCTLLTGAVVPANEQGKSLNLCNPLMRFNRISGLLIG
jgi:hypothetical protein